MASLCFDNDVSLQLAILLRNDGHQVASAEDLGFASATDDEQLVVAFQNHWVLVTYNRGDFTLLHDAWSRWPHAIGFVMATHPGILVLDQAPPVPLFRAVEEILVALPLSALAGELH